jgi:hypothetical protein
MKKYLRNRLVTLAGLVLLALVINCSITVSASEDCLYLSDINYESGSSAGYGSIVYDKNIENGSISLILDEGNSAVSFSKGIAAHATSTIIFDISEFDYDYFVTYAGVNSTKGSNGDGVKFYIYTSTDKKTWTLQTEQNPTIQKGNSVALYYKIDITGVNYIKLYANQNGTNYYDHAVYADAKLIHKNSDSSNTGESVSIKTVAEYDKLIKAGERGLTLLQREFVNNIGYSTLEYFANQSADNAKVLKWLINSEENLTYYLLGGTPDGSYYDSLLTLVRLYKAYASDMDDTSQTQCAGTKGDLYKRMIITLSLTHSATCGLWAGGVTGNISDPNDSDAVERYRIYKKMYLAGKLDTQIFETRTIEEMRFVMNSIIDDESIEWLRDYTYNYSSDAKRNPYTYITYMFGYNYSKEEYYSEENYAKWNEKYKLFDYGITYKTGFPKMWIVFEENGVCGAIAKTGTVIQNSYGVPATVVGQPGHAAYIYQSLNSDGKTVWNLYNDVSGWANSGRTEKLGVRMLNGWGEYNVATYTSTIKPDTYIFLAQEALNDYAKYEAAEKILMLADVYSGDTDKLEEIYQQALAVEPINFDAFYGLVTLYRDTNRSEEDCYKLACQIAEAYTYHPLPMYDLLRILKPLMSSAEYDVKFTLLQNQTLEKASKATASESIQYSGVRAIANALLGTVDKTVATFSFDGDDKNKIVLAERLSGNGVCWDYSLDGGEKWITVNADSVTLSDKEIESITTENSIRVHIVGVDYTEENIYRIEITQASKPSNIYANDLENAVIGAGELMEWRLEGDDTWKCFSDENPNEYLTGNAVIYVRNKATGTKKASEAVSCSFTDNSQPDNRKYVSISHLTLESVSSQQTGNDNYAKYAIDGNINTIWHTAWDGSDSDRYIVIKLDEPIKLSAVEYVPRQDASNGRAKDSVLYVSIDGENWKEVGSGTNWGNNSSWKTIELKESVEAQYIKFVVTANYGDGRSFASAAMINIYEDVTGKSESETENTSSSEDESSTESTTSLEDESSTESTTSSEDESSTENESSTESESSTEEKSETEENPSTEEESESKSETSSEDESSTEEESESESETSSEENSETDEKETSSEEESESKNDSDSNKEPETSNGGNNDDGNNNSGVNNSNSANNANADDNNNDDTIVSESKLKSTAGTANTVATSSEMPVEIPDTVNNNSTDEEVYDILEIAGVSDISDLYDTYDFSDTSDLINSQYAEYIKDEIIDSTTTDETTAKNTLEFTVETPNVTTDETTEKTKNTRTIPIAATSTAAAAVVAGGGIFVFRKRWFFITKRK